MSQSDSSAGEQSEKQKKTKSVPHLINLNEDPMLSRVIFHFLEQGKCCVHSTVKPLPVLSNLLSESPIFFPKYCYFHLYLAVTSIKWLWSPLTESQWSVCIIFLLY